MKNTIIKALTVASVVCSASAMAGGPPDGVITYDEPRKNGYLIYPAFADKLCEEKGYSYGGYAGDVVSNNNTLTSVYIKVAPGHPLNDGWYISKENYQVSELKCNENDPNMQEFDGLAIPATQSLSYCQSQGYLGPIRETYDYSVTYPSGEPQLTRVVCVK